MTRETRAKKSAIEVKKVLLGFSVVTLLYFAYFQGQNSSKTVYVAHGPFRSSTTSSGEVAGVFSPTSITLEEACQIFRSVNSMEIEHDPVIRSKCASHGLQHSFEDVARKFKARKWYGSTSPYEYPHDEIIYARYLPPLRFKAIKFLEIGLGCEKKEDDATGYKVAGWSAKTWLEYFPLARITEAEYFGDCINDWNKYIKPTLPQSQQSRLSIVQCDQEKQADLLRVWGSGGWDVIIEDGGHSQKQQQTTFHTLWPLMKPGAIYFFEDLHTSYLENYGGGDMKRPTDRVLTGASESWEHYNSVEFIMQLLDDMHSGFYMKTRKEIFMEAHDIERFECIRGLCAFVKGKRTA